MTLKEMRQHKWVVSWSGGKDSTATVILMHENGIQIDRIVYVRMMYDENLPATLPVMTAFVDKAISKFRSWGYRVDIVKSIKTAKECANTVYQRSRYPERNGKKYGIMAFLPNRCKFTDIKQRTIRTIESSGYQIIGYCADETERLKRLADNQCSILAVLGRTQKDAESLCKSYGLLSPLYALGAKRDGCWFCPNSKNDERKMLRKNHPELVEKIYEMIEMCDYDISGLCRNHWVDDWMKEQSQVKLEGLEDEVL